MLWAVHAWNEKNESPCSCSALLGPPQCTDSFSLLSICSGSDKLPLGLEMKKAFVFVNFLTAPQSAIPIFLALPALVAHLQEAKVFQAF